jgi:predicted HTH domain antitoxin
MTLTIPDRVLQDSGLSERDFLIEIACRLYDAHVIEQPEAVRLSGLSRVEFWAELERRGLPWMHIDYPIDDDLKFISEGTVR